RPVHRAGLRHRAAPEHADHHARHPDADLEGHGGRAARLAGGDRRDAEPVQHPGGGPAADPRRRRVPRHGPLRDQRGRQLDRHRGGRQVGRRAAAGERGGSERAPHRGGRSRPDIAVQFRLALLFFLFAKSVLAQTEDTPVELTGTLAKVRAAGALTIAYRESSVPFSYLSARGEPIGYSIELCRKLGEAIGEAIGREVALKWLAVTSETRIQAITSGKADLECGSTTNNLERQKLVAFSPVIFVA